MTMLEDKKKYGELPGDVEKAKNWLKEGPNPRFRSICNVIKEIDKNMPEMHDYCCELIWMAKKITAKLQEYREKAK